jgi:hypothetical protein
MHQPKEEVGSAGEQPISNMVDAYTAEGSSLVLPFVISAGMHYCLENSTVSEV